MSFIILITVSSAIFLSLCLVVSVAEFIGSLRSKARSAEVEAGKHNHTQKTHNR